MDTSGANSFLQRVGEHHMTYHSMGWSNVETENTFSTDSKSKVIQIVPQWKSCSFSSSGRSNVVWSRRLKLLTFGPLTFTFGEFAVHLNQIFSKAESTWARYWNNLQDMQSAHSNVFCPCKFDVFIVWPNCIVKHEKLCLKILSSPPMT